MNWVSPEELEELNKIRLKNIQLYELLDEAWNCLDALNTENIVKDEWFQAWCEKLKALEKK